MNLEKIFYLIIFIKCNYLLDVILKSTTGQQHMDKNQDLGENTYIQLFSYFNVTCIYPIYILYLLCIYD